ncbi:type II secretion system protein [Pontiella sulfatireligans]|uniref:Type II secretion system protein G n=1 Tax=Pontiella sulfatireligans TaxID=2750658 RepID=A0A6C2URJ7_9BACT|nr:type II secretion system protein [Pontiella sulfatireligans]VGO22925.1 hypothetical protein SCARR_05022 [Pontiella sulfatireligans]
MNKNGFTLIELLVVIAILALLITLGSKGLRNARISAKKAQAMVEMKSIETAVKSYVSKYGKLPVEFGSDLVFEDSDDSDSKENSKLIISILTFDADAELAENPAKMVFLDPQSSPSADGNFVDPWGKQYRIALDTDYDGELVFGNETVRRKVAVASFGLYWLKGSISTNDIVKSWR